MKGRMLGDYDDIINLPPHVSRHHAPMSRRNRAAQFAPFAALTGYDDCLKEEARITAAQKELSDEAAAILDAKLAYLTAVITTEPALTVSYFVPDAKKAGGMYLTASGRLRRIDEAGGMLIFTDKRQIPLKNVVDIF